MSFPALILFLTLQMNEDPGPIQPLASILVEINQSPDTSTIVEPEETLFPIFVHGRWGFINRQGKVIIEPMYRDIGRFSEGLCPVRKDGLYGYIDNLGRLVIPYHYDYAAPFSEGLARVYQNDQVKFIRSDGLAPWPLEATDSEDFSEGTARISILVNDTVIQRVIDKNGTWHIRTPEEEWTRTEGRIIATRSIPGNDGRSRTEFAVFDEATLDTLVPFGTYPYISFYRGELARVKIHADPAIRRAPDQYGWIDKSGELVITLPKGYWPMTDHFSEGLIAVQAPARLGPVNPSPRREKKVIWFDTRGRIRFEKPGDKQGSPFRNGRSFGGLTRKHYLMDKEGNVLGPHLFEAFRDPDFSDNLVLVADHPNPQERFSDEYLWGAIDSMGEYRIAPQFTKVHPGGFQNEGLWVGVKNPNIPHNPFAQPEIKWGLIDRSGKYLIQPIFERIASSGFDFGLCYVETSEEAGYVDSTGRFVWSIPILEMENGFELLNTLFMIRPEYKVQSSRHPTEYLRTIDVNRPQNISTERHFNPNQFGLQVIPSAQDTFMDQWQGHSAFIYNTTSDTINVDVQDGRVKIIAQALDSQGNWRDIEYFLDSWCGYSYYKAALPPNSYWPLSVPAYDGNMNTQIRLEFHYLTKQTEEGVQEFTLLSKPFPGKIHAAQFWNRRREQFEFNLDE